jgi:formylglycine-generating enzyme required for sulfatase activity
MLLVFTYVFSLAMIVGCGRKGHDGMVKVPDDMVFVKGGTFQMGSNDGESDEKPIHSVTVSDFYIGKYEVTQKEWQDVMGNNPSLTDRGIGDNHPVNQVTWYGILVFYNKLSMKEGFTPVYSISGSTNPDNWGNVPTSGNSTWDAVTCNWNANGYRLPTEAEWEYAARGGSTGSPTTYAGSNNIDKVAWYASNSGDKIIDADYIKKTDTENFDKRILDNGCKTHPVGTKKPNELGIYDMSGNVWEWCWDWYGSYSSSSQTNPRSSISGSYHALRGGSWYSYVYRCRIASRMYNYPHGRSYVNGFRLARAG